jgi:hypothetical protein
MSNLNLQPQHLQEYNQSAIDLDIIALNFRSLGQSAAFDFIVPNPQRRNDGRLTDRYLRIFNNLEAGAWACTGIDVLTMTPSEWGCLKPNTPRWDDKNRKVIKYEHPWGIPTELFCLRVTYRIGLEIATKAGAILEAAYRERIGEADLGDEDLGFWQWVKYTPHLAIIITEGAKKAASLLSAGYCAIALPGIYGGYRTETNSLIPQLAVFVTPEREFAFAFDRDLKPKTIRNVRTAIDRTGKLLERKDCHVSVIAWSCPYKGADDLIASLGVEELDRVFNDRQTLSRWRLAQSFSLDRYDAHKVNTRYLDSDVKPEQLEGKIIALKSAKGTGKTEWLAQQVKPFLDSGRGVLILTHRIQLARTLANRLGVSHIEEVRQEGSLLGYALCVDSLHPKSQARFNPDAWDGAAVVIDECEQVFWHLLNSPTCAIARMSILETLETLFRNIAATNGTIFLSDADLSQVSIEYVQKLTENHLDLWLLINEFNPNLGQRHLTLHPRGSALITKGIAAARRGENIIFHCSAQRARSKYSARTIEGVFKAAIPGLRTLAIDSETVADPQHPAYGCIDNINEIVKDYQVVFCTPVIETGISIDCHHFDAVYCLVNGVQTVDAVAQTLERVRDNVPRHLSIETKAITKVGNGATEIRSLLRSQHQAFKTNVHVLALADTLSDSDRASSAHLNTWASYAANINLGFSNYPANILSKLESEGYTISDRPPTPPTDRQESIAIETSTPEIETTSESEVDRSIEEICDRHYTEHRQEIRAAENPHDLEYQELKKQRQKTKEERMKLAKGQLTRRYLTCDITDELILKDDAGWYPQLQLYYYLTLGRQHLKVRDRGKAKSLNPDGLPFKPDLNRATLSLKIKALEWLDIQQFFGEDKTFTSGDLTEWFERVVKHRWDLKDILKIYISPDSSPIQAAQQFLGLLGMKLDYIDRIRIDGKSTRRYAGVYCDADGRQDVLDRWLDRDDRLAGIKERSTPAYISLMESLA